MQPSELLFDWAASLLMALLSGLRRLHQAFCSVNSQPQDPSADAYALPLPSVQPSSLQTNDLPATSSCKPCSPVKAMSLLADTSACCCSCTVTAEADVDGHATILPTFVGNALPSCDNLLADFRSSANKDNAADASVAHPSPIAAEANSANAAHVTSLVGYQASDLLATFTLPGQDACLMAYRAADSDADGYATIIADFMANLHDEVSQRPVCGVPLPTDDAQEANPVDEDSASTCASNVALATVLLLEDVIPAGFDPSAGEDAAASLGPLPVQRPANEDAIILAFLGADATAEDSVAALLVANSLTFDSTVPIGDAASSFYDVASVATNQVAATEPPPLSNSAAKCVAFSRQPLLSHFAVKHAATVTDKIPSASTAATIAAIPSYYSGVAFTEANATTTAKSAIVAFTAATSSFALPPPKSTFHTNPTLLQTTTLLSPWIPVSFDPGGEVSYFHLNLAIIGAGFMLSFRLRGRMWSVQARESMQATDRMKNIKSHVERSSELKIRLMVKSTLDPG